jgi:ABC-2 type transport system ATP-binding protein
MDSMSNALEIQNLQKIYGVGDKARVAIKDISLSVPKGQFLGILGSNGAGKTTTINCISGITEPTGGTISVMGYDVVSQYRMARVQVGLSPQEFTIDIFQSPEEILYYQAGFFGIIGEERKARIEKFLDIFELQPHRSKRFQFLSGGLKRRVVVAKALLHNPELIILDEPTAGVDVETRQVLWKYLKDLHASGKTILLTSHYLEEVEALCERVVMIKSGTIVYDADMKDATEKGSLQSKYLEIVADSNL